MARNEHRVTRKFEVTTTTCNSHRKTRSIVVSTETRSEAIERAIEKMYGSRCFWFGDSGLPGYGQVFEALQSTRNNSNPGNSSVTDRVSLDVRPLAEKSRAFLKQEAEDRQAEQEDAKYAKLCRDANSAGFDAAVSGQPRPKYEDSIFDYESERGYHDGLDAINEDRERSENEARQEREETVRYHQEQVDAERTRTENRNARRERNHQRLVAEVDRIRAIDVTQSVTDTILHAVINSIAVVSFKHTMPLGEWKRRMQAGEFPEVVRQYVQSDWIFTRLENVVPREWEIGDLE